MNSLFLYIHWWFLLKSIIMVISKYWFICCFHFFCMGIVPLLLLLLTFFYIIRLHLAFLFLNLFFLVTISFISAQVIQYLVNESCPLTYPPISIWVFSSFLEQQNVPNIGPSLSCFLKVASSPQSLAPFSREVIFSKIYDFLVLHMFNCIVNSWFNIILSWEMLSCL